MFAQNFQQRLQNPHLNQHLLIKKQRVQARQSLKVLNATGVAETISIPVKDISGQQSSQKDLQLREAKDTAVGLIHKAVVYERALKRRGTASTLTRAQVRGGGKKPYPQKGTGNARRGSSRSPLIVGGGVIFGPKPKDWSHEINRKELKLAIGTALQDAARHGDLTVLEDLNDKFSERKTKLVQEALKSLGVTFGKKPEKALIILSKENLNLHVGGRNIPTLKTLLAEKLNVYDILNADKIFIESSALGTVQRLYGEEMSSQQIAQ